MMIIVQIVGFNHGSNELLHHWATDVTLNTHINLNMYSFIYEMGILFIDYLNNVSMNRAKERAIGLRSIPVNVLLSLFLFVCFSNKNIHDADKTIQKYLAQQLENIHLDALRAICGAVRGMSRKSVDKQTGFVLLTARRKYHKLCTMCQLCKGTTPAYLSEKVSEKLPKACERRFEILHFRVNAIRTLRLRQSCEQPIRSGFRTGRAGPLPWRLHNQRASTYCLVTFYFLVFHY